MQTRRSTKLRKKSLHYKQYADYFSQLLEDRKQVATVARTLNGQARLHATDERSRGEASHLYAITQDDLINLPVVERAQLATSDSLKDFAKRTSELFVQMRAQEVQKISKERSSTQAKRNKSSSRKTSANAYCKQKKNQKKPRSVGKKRQSKPCRSSSRHPATSKKLSLEEANEFVSDEDDDDEFMINTASVSKRKKSIKDAQASSTIASRTQRRSRSKRRVIMESDESEGEEGQLIPAP